MTTAIEDVIDGQRVVAIADISYNKGAVALGSGWNEACFDNITIEPINQ